MLEIINLDKKFKNKIVLSSVNMRLDSTGIIFFLGKNGAGKTTFFNCIMGFEDYSGEIMKSRNIAAVFDESHLYCNLNAYDNIALLVRRDLDENEQELLLKYIDVSVLKRKVKSYSLGQKKDFVDSYRYIHKAGNAYLG
ncbi:ATP-binding cassette domain-containing protein [Listeria cornellensis]|uniref:Multidrug ABC transporter ATPase n=1 Tax=Listeria cornellensis FSL F6-0969 TaxID=1265820 RepID=W7C4I7_9LIST|nr:ATP-binding cassette domain-containing protein [Listeria cornellensis]EUJ32145.1 multidrug ABC transporter ATPase [Listeria cornellensis FSL F6-0969]